ncbi:pyruvate dehydrogenase complex dihydrolipoamide acetyltransferase [Arenibacter troitsensis]|uniref:Dihydrolipoamide acetyltransferase component of pyruvate dehydrogenase complex n=1 Tax=Arenibacter troitsensis TaxID=188872 RepID=A0A1X7KD12_9FLAO|nr:pyruvate dehydrogenase complex dihydrolipoamide acetyltransferase [Arenibacter troitsensis]SMG39112.1 pyruvate dehydrogenase E2 component (dihydrolipoamide acetyltransferase) [Arenibacter troitsensis]
MAEVINMPRLSDTMEEGTVAKWLKKVGDKIEEGDILAEIETDKATMEFESFNEGTLLYIGIKEGDTAPVDSLLAIIGEKGEDVSGLINNASSDDKEEKQTEAVAEKEEKKEAPKTTATAIPDGVEIVKMPRLSDTMEEGTVATWLKKVGDEVEEGDILAEIETDKATMEFESFYAGTLLYVGINEGETAPVDSVLAVIGPKGTDVDAVLSAGSGSASEDESAPAEAKKAEAPSSNGQESAPIAANDGQRIFASPLAKKIAQDRGINLEDVKGSGDQGRIIKKDIEEYQPKQKAAEKTIPAQEKASSPQTAVAVPINLPVGQEGTEEVKNSQMRKVIAKRLGESKFSAPHYYLTIEVDMDYAKTSREQINGLPDTKVSFNDMVVKACAMALKKHPQVNTSWNNETTRYNQHVHIGVAVAVEDGLLVPVLKFADQMTLTQIGASVKDLAGKARNKKISPAEMEGSTFTVSNLGMFGITEFTSIINQPNSAILSVGAIVQKPVVKNGQIVVGNTMKVTLACDHRTVDGATGAQFLQTLRAYLENPVTMLA